MNDIKVNKQDLSIIMDAATRHLGHLMSIHFVAGAQGEADKLNEAILKIQDQMSEQ